MHTRVSFSHICILIVAFRNDEEKRGISFLTLRWLFRCKLYLCSLFWLASLYIIKMYFIFIDIRGHQFQGFRQIYCFEDMYFLGSSVNKIYFYNTLFNNLILLIYSTTKSNYNYDTKTSVYWILMNCMFKELCIFYLL